jgi:4-aminobutyrate aminotransferase-like enzyme
VLGDGAYLYDADGRAYLDCVNNVAHVGHAHPRVVEAGAAQMRVLNTNTRYLHETVLRYAERLTGLLPGHLEVAYFTNSGSEANELALRLARTATGRPDVATVDVAYHGNTQRLVEISPQVRRTRWGGATGRRQVVPLPDGYRGDHRGSDRVTADAYLDEARAVPAGRGERPPPAPSSPSVPSVAARWSRRTGGSWPVRRRPGDRRGPDADEVQVGFGRAASTWAFGAAGGPGHRHGGQADGNGHPLGAVVTTRAIADAFANGMEYFNTFGGNPVSAAIGLAVLDVIEDEGLREHARVTGERLIGDLRDLATRHEAIGDVRGLGLFVGIELVRDRATREPDAAVARELANRAAERRVLLSTDGPDHNVMKIKPPLVFSEPDADRLIETIGGADGTGRRTLTASDGDGQAGATPARSLDATAARKLLADRGGRGPDVEPPASRS